MSYTGNLIPSLQAIAEKHQPKREYVLQSFAERGAVPPERVRFQMTEADALRLNAGLRGSKSEFRWKVVGAALLLVLLSCFASAQESAPATSADIQSLTAQIAELQRTIALQNALLAKALDPPKPKHRKIVKVLLTVERVATDVGSAASISSVLGWVRP